MATAFVSRAAAFASVVKIVADSPEQIRACDVDRLLSSAMDAFDVGEFYMFAAWLYFSGAKVGIHAEIDAWLAEEDASRIEFQEETFSLTFRDRSAFNSISEALNQCPLVIDIGYSDMTIIFRAFDAEAS